VDELVRLAKKEEKKVTMPFYVDNNELNEKNPLDLVDIDEKNKLEEIEEIKEPKGSEEMEEMEEPKESEEPEEPEEPEVSRFFSRGVLYSHFKLIFNYSAVFIFIFFYPGNYWDFAYEKPVEKRDKFPNILSKLYNSRTWTGGRIKFSPFFLPYNIITNHLNDDALQHIYKKTNFKKSYLYLNKSIHKFLEKDDEIKSKNQELKSNNYNFYGLNKIIAKHKFKLKFIVEENEKINLKKKYWDMENHDTFLEKKEKREKIKRKKLKDKVREKEKLKKLTLLTYLNSKEKENFLSSNWSLRNEIFEKIKYKFKRKLLKLKKNFKLNFRKRKSFRFKKKIKIDFRKTIYWKKNKSIFKFWRNYNKRLRKFFWKKSSGLHFFLSFLFIFKPFSIISNFRKLYFKDNLIYEKNVYQREQFLNFLPKIVIHNKIFDRFINRMKIFFSIPKKYFSFYTNFFFYFSSVDFLNQNGFFFYPKSKLINYKLINNNFRVIYDNFSKKTFSKKVVYSFKKFLLTFKYIYKISFYINLVIKPKYRRSYPFVLTGSFYRYFQNTLKNLKFFIKNILRDGLKRIWIEKNYKSLEFFHIYNAFKKGLVLKFIQSKKSIIYYFNSYKNFYKNFYMNNILSKKFLFFEKRRRQKAIFKFFFENKLLKLFKNNEEEGKVLKKIFDRNLLEFSKRENFFNKTSFLLKKSQFLKKFTGGLQKSFIKKEIIFNKTFLKKVLLKKFSQLKEFFQIKNLYVKKKKNYL